MKRPAPAGFPPCCGPHGRGASMIPAPATAPGPGLAAGSGNRAGVVGRGCFSFFGLSRAAFILDTRQGAAVKRGATMFRSPTDLVNYIKENYPEVTDHRIDDDHWDLECTQCKVTRGFQVIRRDISGVDNARRYGGAIAFKEDFYAPHTYLFCCPVCKAFKQWIVFRIQLPTDEAGKSKGHYFRVTSLPSEGLEDIDELPIDPPSLRTAYRQAIRAMDANAHLAAAAMFRRALQVITRDLLGAKPGNLANELNGVVGKAYNGVVVTNNFAKVGYIIKEAGNQGRIPTKTLTF
jgi:hypothetical protein